MIIILTQGQRVIVDDADAELVGRYQWYAHWNPYTRSFYARTNAPVPGGGQMTLRMHRLILGASSGQIVDHINHDTLDNRRSNLRLATRIGNSRNVRGPRRDNRSGYIGVRRMGKRWQARARVSGTLHHLGTFDTPEDAAIARDEWWRTNLPSPVNTSNFTEIAA